VLWREKVAAFPRGFFIPMKTSPPDIKKNRSFQTQPLTHYLKAGKREFATLAQKLAMIEQAADLEAGSVIFALLARMPNSPDELAEWISSGWMCSQSLQEIEAALTPVLRE
jgi:hypothetical protein